MRPFTSLPLNNIISQHSTSHTNFVRHVDSVNGRHMILKMHYAIKRDCHTFGIRDGGKDRVRGAEKGDGGRSAAATNIYCQGCGVAPPKVGRCHRGSKGTGKVCILQERDGRSRSPTQTRT